jgi:putative SOS response-associated peptidase YedK
MSRRSTPQKSVDDTSFPVRIKVRIPERGMGTLAGDYLGWLNRNLGPSAYANHATSCISGSATAFYFTDLGDAHSFLEAFPMLVLADSTMSPSYSSPNHDGAWQSEHIFGVCNLYSMTSAQDAIRQLFDGLDDRVGNLPSLPSIYPDYQAPVVSLSEDKPVLSMMRWGLPSPAFALKGRKTDRGVTNVRNTKSPHWRRWLGVSNRCVVPFTAFSEPYNQPGKPSVPVWFTLGEDEPLGFFAGIWTEWTSVRKLKDGETTDNLFAFLTTDANAEVGKVHPKAMPVILRDQGPEGSGGGRKVAYG